MFIKDEVIEKISSEVTKFKRKICNGWYTVCEYILYELKSPKGITILNEVEFNRLAEEFNS